MAIEKTGVEVDVSSSFESPTTFEENGMVDHIDIDGLNQLTEYYVRGYIIENGSTTYSDNTLSFNTTFDWPEELQMVEYLESDGDCYILLQNVPTQDINMLRVKCQGYTGNATLFGSRESGDSLQLFSNNRTEYSFRFFSSSALDSGVNSNDLLEFSYENDIADFNGSQISNTNPTTPISEPVLLFGLNNQGTYVLHDHAKFYEFVTNLCYLIPCYIKPGETIEDTKGQTCVGGDCGFYDVLNQCFYSNDGTANFIPGPDL